METSQLLQLLQQTGLEDDPKAQQLLAAATAAQSDHVQSQAHTALKLYIQQHTQTPFATGTPQTQHEITVGHTTNNQTYTLTPSELSQHTLITGRSGSGKTNLLYHLLTQLTVPWWSFDLKQDYRHLLNQPETDLVVLPADKLRYNPIEPPPGVQPNQWLQTFAATFADSQALLNASENFTKKTVRNFGTDLQTYANRQINQPSLYQILRTMEQEGINFARKQSNYRDTVTNRLRGICSDLPDTFKTQRSMDLVSLLDRNVVFELDGYSKNTQNFIMEMLLAWIYEYRKAQNHRGSQLRHLTVADEAKTMFSTFKEQSVEQGIPVIDDTLAKLREFEEGVLVADQELQKLTDSLKSNTYLKVLLSTANDDELGEAASTLGLNQYQEVVADNLSVGQAIVRRADEKPVQVSIPEVDVEKQVSDTEVKDAMQAEWERYLARAEQNQGYSTDQTQTDTGSEDDSGSSTLTDF